MTPKELAERLSADGEQPLLLDVREPWEFDICRIEGSKLLPMRDVISSLDSLDRNQEMVVICHHGIRSQQVALYLDRQGFQRIINLSGGVNAWARSVDTAMPTY